MTEAPATEGKKVSWAELYFDLVFVFAVTRVSELLHHDHTVRGLVEALVIFVPIYWVWVGTTIQANLNDMGSTVSRLSIFTVALGGLFMALAVGQAYEDWALMFALAYWGSRIVLGRLFLGSRLTLNPVTLSIGATGPILVVGALLGGDAQLALWALAAVVDLSSPSLMRVRLRGMHFDAEHLAERFGLFVLIAIGESVVAIGSPVAASHHLEPWSLVAVALAFALSCGLWWVYFHFAADAVRHALSTAAVQMDITRHVLSYGHIAFIAAVIAMAVGMGEAVVEPTHAMSWAIAVLLYGGCAAFLAAFGYTRWMMFRKVSWTRLIAAGAVLVALPVATLVPGAAAIAILAALLAALNVVEYRIVLAREAL